jgi:hypothetical protein
VSTLRDQILGTEDISIELMVIPEWGDAKIEIRSMTAGERSQMMQSVATPDGQVDFTAMYPAILIKSVYDPDTGQHIFNDSDAALVNSKNGGVVERIAIKAMKMSGMDNDSRRAVGNDSSETGSTDSPSS